MLGPRSMDSRPHTPISPQRSECSTRQLISQYEAISLSHIHGRSVVSPSFSESAPLTNRRGKDKSPIRQSFRNLFSVFTKANVVGKGKTDDESDPPLSKYRNKCFPVTEDFSRATASPAVRSRSRQMVGSLLYLSQLPSDSAVIPVWIACTVTLEGGSIVISWHTVHGSSSTHIVSLSRCTDVRSLSLQQLDPEESALLPKSGKVEQCKNFIFEILFDGRARERFAAPSVQERAGWISAIWDAVLPAQGRNRDAKSPVAEIINKLPTTSSRLTVPVFRLLPVADALRSVPYSERSLPPIPGESKAQNLDTNIRTRTPSPASPSIYSPTQPVSRILSGIDSRCTSPSIKNLSQLSVVRQRLAQIERNSSQSSHRGLMSPISSERSNSTHLTTPLLESKKGVITNYQESPQMSRVQGIRSGTGYSTLDSYDEEHMDDRIPAMSRSEEDLQQSMMKYCLRPFAELLHDHAAKTYDQTANLGDQIISLQDEVYRMSNDFASIIDEKSDSRVHTTISQFDNMVESNGEILRLIYNKMQDNWPSYCSSSPIIMEELKTIRQCLTTNFKTETSHSLEPHRPVTLANLAPSTSSSTISPVVSLSTLNTKLDDLLGAYKTKTFDRRDSGQSETAASISELIALFQEDKVQRTLQARQQTESVRYLNELNSWLEALVNNGTSHIQGLSAGVEQLCWDLGSSEGGTGILANIHRMTLSTAASEQRSIGLQASINELLRTIEQSNVVSITSLMDRHRQDQEKLIHALAKEISDEIKGERLRFVEAMKEATAINVQTHVEQFRKELKREVIEMTQEVGRLYRDREGLQNQIADLFAFYAKQKATGEISQLHTVAIDPAVDHHIHEPPRYGQLPQPNRS